MCSTYSPNSIQVWLDPLACESVWLLEKKTPSKKTNTAYRWWNTGAGEIRDSQSKQFMHDSRRDSGWWISMNHIWITSYFDCPNSADEIIRPREFIYLSKIWAAWITLESHLVNHDSRAWISSRGDSVIQGWIQPSESHLESCHESPMNHLLWLSLLSRESPVVILSLISKTLRPYGAWIS